MIRVNLIKETPETFSKFTTLRMNLLFFIFRSFNLTAFRRRACSAKFELNSIYVVPDRICLGLPKTWEVWRWVKKVP